MRRMFGLLAALAAPLLLSGFALAQAPTPAPSPAPLPAPLPPPAAPFAPPAPAVAAPPPPTTPPLAGNAKEEAEAEEHFEFFDPQRPFQLPPPPPPPSPSWVLSSFFRVYDYVGGSVHGASPHVGVTFGGRGGAAMIGFMPNPNMFSLGVELPRFRGVNLTQMGSMQLALLGPTFESHVFTDFSDNGYLNIGASVLGLGVSSCSLGKSGMAYFIQLRGPLVHAWLPFLIDGETDTSKTHASPFVSVGVGLEAGLVFF